VGDCRAKVGRCRESSRCHGTDICSVRSLCSIDRCSTWDESRMLAWHYENSPPIYCPGRSPSFRFCGREKEKSVAVLSWNRKNRGPYYELVEANSSALADARAARSLISTRSPLGDRLRQATVPPQASTQLLTIARPRPTPPVSRWRAESGR
jgi:hypothetical protein